MTVDEGRDLSVPTRRKAKPPAKVLRVHIAVSFAFLILAFPALGAGMADTAMATCKDYETGSHQDMLDIEAAVLQALKGDPSSASLSATALDVAIYKVCAGQPDAKVTDALRSNK